MAKYGTYTHDGGQFSGEVNTKGSVLGFSRETEPKGDLS